MPTSRAGGGVGIHGRLKISWSKDLAGSSPARPTKNRQFSGDFLLVGLQTFANDVASPEVRELQDGWRDF